MRLFPLQFLASAFDRFSHAKYAPFSFDTDAGHVVSIFCDKDEIDDEGGCSDFIDYALDEIDDELAEVSCLLSSPRERPFVTQHLHLQIDMREKPIQEVLPAQPLWIPQVAPWEAWPSS